MYFCSFVKKKSGLEGTKGQIISICLFGVSKSTKKTNEIIVRISALASKKRLNQKIRVLYTTNWMISF